MKQWIMAESFRPSDPEGRVNYVIGDVRDKSALRRIMSGIDIVAHAAALDPRTWSKGIADL